MSGERFTLDTNLLVYSIDRAAGAKQAMAQTVVRMAAVANCRLTLQTVSEFYAVATRKGHLPPDVAAGLARDWLDLFPCLPHSGAATRQALDLAGSKRASYWDALLLCTAAEGGCGTILSEDMADGAVVGGVRIVNPFGPGALTPAAMQVLAPAG